MHCPNVLLVNTSEKLFKLLYKQSLILGEQFYDTLRCKKKSTRIVKKQKEKNKTKTNNLTKQQQQRKLM